MDQEKEEFGRFEPSGDFPPHEPVEPFFPDEMLEPTHKPESPSVKGLHIPPSPMSKKKFKEFLIELEPIVDAITQISRQDQHLVASHLQVVKNELHSGDFDDDVVSLFEEIVTHFNALLTHSTPPDQMAVLEALHKLIQKL